MCKGCDKIYPCSTCSLKGIECEPQKAEFIKRARDVQDRLLAGEFYHDELALYTLQLCSIRQHKKNLMKKWEHVDIMKRLKIEYPEYDVIPKMFVEDLPMELSNFIKQFQRGAWKVEWMYDGVFMAKKSNDWDLMFDFNKSAHKELYSKLVDTMGFNHWDMAYRMWIESLRYQCQIIKYEGMGYQKAMKETNFQTARMMSKIIDYQHIITVTIIF